jgi:hypothetical protein
MEEAGKNKRRTAEESEGKRLFSPPLFDGRRKR